jgi:transcriptional regulator
MSKQTVSPHDESQMTRAKSDLPQGTLDMLILTSVASGPQHGYAIAQRLQQISRDVIQVRQGSLYPALHRLENRGLLATEWRQSETGRDARYYSLTRKGSAELESERANWRRLTRAVSVILRTAEGGAL